MSLKARLIGDAFLKLGIIEEITPDKQEVIYIESDKLSPSEKAWQKDRQLGYDLDRGAVFRGLPKKTPNSKKRRDHIRTLVPNVVRIRDPKVIRQERMRQLVERIIEEQKNGL